MDIEPRPISDKEILKSKKVHICYYCQKLIESGSYYKLFVVSVNNKIKNLNKCEDCIEEEENCQ